MTISEHALALLCSSESVEWYTPAHIVDRARLVLGGIDIDPASCARANETVRATRYYTAQEDGLLRPWEGRVWLNPPYGAVIGDWTERLHTGYATGEIEAALTLLPVRPDTQWWWQLRSYPVCFITGRLRFANSPHPCPHASALVYLGPRVDHFGSVFGPLGLIYLPAPTQEKPVQASLSLFVEVQP